MNRMGYLLLLVLLMGFLFLFAGRPLLVINEQPKKADAIIVLSGDTGRLSKAAELYHDGYAGKIMMSLVGEHALTVDEAIALGVRKEDLILETQATSTYTNAVYTKELMEEHGLHSALVVSSDYHMRRVALSFERVFKSSGIDLVYIASQRGKKPWHADKQNLIFTAKEWIKLPAYAMKMYHFVDVND